MSSDESIFVRSHPHIISTGPISYNPSPSAICKKWLLVHNLMCERAPIVASVFKSNIYFSSSLMRSADSILGRQHRIWGANWDTASSTAEMPSSIELEHSASVSCFKIIFQSGSSWALLCWVVQPPGSCCRSRYPGCWLGLMGAGPVWLVQPRKA